MNIALIGYGKMGKAIEKISLERGHTISLIIDSKNKNQLTNANLKQCDVAIEFSKPECVLENVMKCVKSNIPIVVGTTAWLDSLDKVKNIVSENNGALVWASNYSLGANIFFKMNKEFATIINQYIQKGEYDVQIEEIHHTQKLDSPSGTALTIGNDLLTTFQTKKSLQLLGVKGNSELSNLKYLDKEKISINSIRIDEIPGTHIVNYFSTSDSITLTHTAHNRTGFALGATIAAEKISSQKGFFEFRDLLFNPCI